MKLRHLIAPAVCILLLASLPFIELPQPQREARLAVHPPIPVASIGEVFSRL